MILLWKYYKEKFLLQVLQNGELRFSDNGESEWAMIPDDEPSKLRTLLKEVGHHPITLYKHHY